VGTLNHEARHTALLDHLTDVLDMTVLLAVLVSVIELSLRTNVTAAAVTDVGVAAHLTMDKV